MEGVCPIGCVDSGVSGKGWGHIVSANGWVEWEGGGPIGSVDSEVSGKEGVSLGV